MAARDTGPAPGAPGLKPPHSLDAEREVLSAVFIDPSAMDKLSGLRPDEFYFERHQGIFTVLADLHSDGRALDLVTVQQALKDRGLYEKVGGARTLGELLERGGTAQNIEHYRRIVQEKAALRRVSDAVADVGTAVHSNFDGAVDGALERLEIAKQQRRSLLSPVESWAAATLANAASVERDAAPQVVVSTGLAELDRYLPAGGYEGGNLIVIIGPPKTGKTTYALGTLTRNCCEQGRRVLYSALSDAGLRRLNRKMMCGVSGVPDKAVKRRDLSDRQYAEWVTAADHISEWKLHIERNPDPRAIVSRAKVLAAEGDLALVVVDYLQRTKTGAREMWQDMAAATGIFQDGAVDLDIPFVVLSQPTTEARRTGKKIRASDTKGGGTSEEDGDLVILLQKGRNDPGAAGLEILAGRDVEPYTWHAESAIIDGKSVSACGWRWNYRTMRLECP